MVVYHTFSSAIPDDPASATAGEVLPSHWNSSHTISGVFSNENLFNASTITTTDATVTTVAVVPIPSSTTLLLNANVIARRTGGVSGSLDDGAGYIIAACYKNLAGVATEIGEGSYFSAEDQAGWACTITPSGSDALLQVTGAANNNISWKAFYTTFTVSS